MEGRLNLAKGARAPHMRAMSAREPDPLDDPQQVGDPQPGRLARMPRVVTMLALAIAVAHLASYVIDARAFGALPDALAVTPLRFATGEIGPVGAIASLFGHAFVHAGLLHLFFNLMIILQTGEAVAARFGRDTQGAVRFLALFFGSAAAGAVAYVLINWGSPVSAVGASGAACGLFAAYLLAPYPDWRAALRAPQTVRMAAAFLFVNVALAAAARVTGVLPIAWEAHLGGFIAGLVLFPLLVPRRAAT